MVGLAHRRPAFEGVLRIRWRRALFLALHTRGTQRVDAFPNDIRTAGTRLSNDGNGIQWKRLRYGAADN